MRTRHALVSLGLAGVLVCGGSALASAATSDSLSTGTTSAAVPAAGRLQPIDEASALHLDDNGDDISKGAFVGLEVEVEAPRELVEPVESGVEFPGVTV